MQRKRAIIWFRQDLRLHDNEALHEAIKHADEIIPMYVFDDRVFGGRSMFGFPKTDRFRARFIMESVADLRNSLRAIGSDLIVRVGKPEEEIFKVARLARTSWVFCNRERTQEEEAVQDELELKLWSIGQEVRFSRGKMLYYTADLPFPVTHTPDIFTQFRKEVERFIPIRPPLPSPEELNFPKSFAAPLGDIPTLADFDLLDEAADPRAVIAFKGGETSALQRLDYYFWQTDNIKSYKETRNGLEGGDYSSKFSPWLAQGCLSPKMIYYELKRYEAAKGANESTYWLFFELLWRDFFRFMAKKHGNKIFMKGGIKGQPRTDLKQNRSLLDIWIAGRTGVPFIDANMRELALTGFMSNRGRQNVASFLVNDLSVDWRMGADYFESVLIDYDPCSNWGNWNYLGGVGSDPRENRYFNILSQAKRYDPKGEYIRLWLPELQQVPDDKVYQPELLSNEEQENLQFRLGADYPKPMITTSKWG